MRWKVSVLLLLLGAEALDLERVFAHDWIGAMSIVMLTWAAYLVGRRQP